MQESRLRQSESSRPCRRSPGGVCLPIHGRVKGKLRWQVLDERGVPEIPRTPSGIPVGPVEGVEQDNLITDAGLDGLASFSYNSISTTGSSWRRFLAVGTGSTAPDVTDTALASEVQAAASSGAFADGSSSYELDDDNDVWRATVVVTRLVTVTADRNLTEFGFRAQSIGSLHIRELLRDAEGDPITVSLLTGKTLRVDHTLTVELPAPEAGIPATVDFEEYDAGNNLVGTTPYDVIYGGHVQSSSPASGGIANVFAVWNPAGTSLAPVAYTSDQAYTRFDTTNPGSALTSLNGWQPYTPGSFQRTFRYTIPTGSLNTTWHAIKCGTGSGGDRAGLLIVFDNPATYTKQNTDTVRIGWVSSWSRA